MFQSVYIVLEYTFPKFIFFIIYSQPRFHAKKRLCC